MWIRDTQDIEAVHVPGMDKATVMDGFVHPFKAILTLSPNGDICQEIRGGRLGNIAMTIKKAMSNKKKQSA